MTGASTSACLCAQQARDGVGKKAHIGGLDSLRIVCALWVVFAHLGFFPVVRELDRTSPLGMAGRGAVGNLFAGLLAVIVFF